MSQPDYTTAMLIEGRRKRNHDRNEGRKDKDKSKATANLARLLGVTA